MIGQDEEEGPTEALPLSGENRTRHRDANPTKSAPARALGGRAHTRPPDASSKLGPGGDAAGDSAAADWARLKCRVMRELVNSR